MGYLSATVRQHLSTSGLVKDFTIDLHCVSKLIQLSKKKKRKKKQLRPCYKQQSPQARDCSELYRTYFSQPQLDWNDLLDVRVEQQWVWMTDGRAPSSLLLPTSKSDIKHIVEIVAWAIFGSLKVQCHSVNRKLLDIPLDKQRDNYSAK